MPHSQPHPASADCMKTFLLAQFLVAVPQLSLGLPGVKILLLQDDLLWLGSLVQLFKSLDWKERRCFSSLLTDLGFVSAHLLNNSLILVPATLTQG